MQLERPNHVKYRREAGFGLVYDHHNYGYEDATLSTVNEVVIDVLERVDDGPVTYAELQREFSSRTIDVMLEEGYLSDA